MATGVDDQSLRSVSEVRAQGFGFRFLGLGLSFAVGSLRLGQSPHSGVPVCYHQDTTDQL